MGTFGRCQHTKPSSSAAQSSALPAIPRPHLEKKPFWADPQALLADRASIGFRHDFKRISVFSFSSGTIQAKLAVNAPGDRFEQEADRIASQIMCGTASPIHSAAQEIQPKYDNPQTAPTPTEQSAPMAPEAGASTATEAAVRSLDSGGEPLGPALRAFFEPRFGHSFERVRIHADASAAALARDLSALAYTRGSHIVFAPGQFEPASSRGQRLLAHELTHVVQQGWAGQERIQRSYLAPTSNAIVRQEVPPCPVVITTLTDDMPEIQRAPDTPGTPPDAALASPTLNFIPGDTIKRGENLIARVDFTPLAGEKLTVTGWRYTARGGDVVTRDRRDAKFNSEWRGVMALSGEMELSFTVKARGKPAVTGTPVTTPVTVTDRTGPNWQTAVTDAAEGSLAGKPSPPELDSDLGAHTVPGDFPAAARDEPVRGGPNNNFVFASEVTDPNYRSEPFIHPDLLNPGSGFMVFHRNAGLLFYAPRGRIHTLIPSADYRIVTVSGDRFTFSVRDWTAFYKKYGFWTVTLTASGKTVTAHDNWWRLNPNAENGLLVITNPGAALAALGVPPGTQVSMTMQPAGAWETIALMRSDKILQSTRSHEYQHTQQSHRANFHAMVRALDPRRVIESTVSTPSNRVAFRDRIRDLRAEIIRPNHELVDETASRAAGKFVQIPGRQMAAVNQDAASGASLGTVWDITHDRELGHGAGG